MADLIPALTHNEYPGRIVGCARTADGQVVAFYGLTGRSPASLERQLSEVADQRLSVISTSSSQHDPLRHYDCALVSGSWLVVGNGEQVSATGQRLNDGLPPTVAVDNLPYEPDPPLFTPRITAVFDVNSPGAVVLAATRKPPGRREAADLMTLTVSSLTEGDIVFLTTYQTRAGVVTAAQGNTQANTNARDPSALLNELWSSLPVPLRVAAAVIPVRPGRPTYLVRNR